jgi:hypothetical protein
MLGFQPHEARSVAILREKWRDLRLHGLEEFFSIYFDLVNAVFRLRRPAAVAYGE